MNYRRIYDQFIADRRAREAGLSGYTETHHVLPRCMGGTDDAANLIRLTAEDHFFAHLLLAKAYGGRLWAPVAFMVGGDRKHYRPTISRKRYGWVKAAMGRALSGDGAHQFDHRIHALRHMDGRVWAGLQSDMVTLGMSKPLANMLLRGRVNSAKGWYLAEREAPTRSGSAHPMYRKEIHTFIHEDGRVLVGTQFDLHVKAGVVKSGACRLARGQAKAWSGWRIKKAV